jgi:hypothetical protein
MSSAVTIENPVNRFAPSSDTPRELINLPFAKGVPGLTTASPRLSIQAFFPFRHLGSPLLWALEFRAAVIGDDVFRHKNSLIFDGQKSLADEFR